MVISSLVNFWSSAFILPKGCLKKIDRLCSRFLWSSSVENRTTAKVAWTVVCLPKNEGGAGLKSFRERNITLCLKMIWKLFKTEDSLWSKWHKLYNLKDRTLWELKETPSTSWNWRTLLRLRQDAEKFLRCKLGNGRKASFWFDHWSPLGPLITLMGEHGPNILRVPLKAKVADTCTHGRWNIAQPRSDNALRIHAYLSSITLPLPQNVEDIYIWYVKDESTTEYVTSSTWEALRVRGQISQWTKSIWYKRAIPKQVFIMWLAHLDRLPTRQRLATWGQVESSECSLRRIAAETKDHLFLSCPFALRIWTWAFQRLSPMQNTFGSWENLLAWTRATSSAASRLLRKTATQTIIYNI